MKNQKNQGDENVWIPLAFIASGMMAWCTHGVLSSSLHSSKEDRDLRERVSKVESAVFSEPNDANESIIQDSNVYEPNQPQYRINDNSVRNYLEQNHIS